MLDIANAENKSKNVTFMQLSMNDLSSLKNKFDIILSSLAVHYIKDFDRLLHSNMSY
jgi:trans-aconitate methyltransferase